MDLDAMLDEAADTVNLKKEVNLDQLLKDRNVMNDVKPWLAFSSNVPPATRDSWSQMVKVDALADLQALPFQPSNAYYSSETISPLPGPKKLLQELVRNAAQNCGFDETKTAKLMQLANPVIETEAADNLQKAYRRQLIADVASAVRKDPNYSADRFPVLAAALASP
jgi:hypothetical protein